MINKYSKVRTQKWIIIITLIAVVCIGLILGFVFIRELHSVKYNKLTIEKVRQLSKKGDKLSWEDFQRYDGIEIGSGLYIKWYQINAKYSLLVGSGGSTLMYVYLQNNNDEEKRIDIRYDDIDKFLTNTP